MFQKEGGSFLLPFYVVKRTEGQRMHRLSITEWHDLAGEGAPIPMRILIRGNSMFPLIRINRDYVTIYPLQGRPETGDIVMFAIPERNRYVLHRAWKVEDDRVLTWGDNCKNPDGWLPLEMIWGKAVLIERGKRDIRPDRKAGMRLARLWHHVGWIWRLSARYYHKARKQIGQLKARIRRM